MKSNNKLVLNIILSFTIVFFLLINIGLNKIFFYNGLFSMLLSFLIVLIIFLKSKKNIVILTLLFSFLLHFTIFLFIPVTVDRSISVNLLIYLDSEYSDELFEYKDIENQIIDYTTSKDFTDKRINEQIASNNIIVEGNKYKLTSSGKFLVKLFDIVSKIYGN